MDKDIELTSYLLRYLLKEGYFESKREMAETLDVTKRILQRLMNEPEKLKRGSESLGKVLCYFAIHHIPLDDVLAEYMSTDVPTVKTEQLHEAYRRLKLSEPEMLTSEEKDIFLYGCDYLCTLSQYICPTCEKWCNPWSKAPQIEKQNCMIGRLSKRLQDAISQICTAEGDDG